MNDHDLTRLPFDGPPASRPGERSSSTDELLLAAAKDARGRDAELADERRAREHQHQLEEDNQQRQELVAQATNAYDVHAGIKRSRGNYDFMMGMVQGALVGLVVVGGVALVVQAVKS